MEIVTVLIAGVAGYVFGAVWYGVLGQHWQAAAGLTDEDVRPGRNLLAYIIALLCNIVVAGMMRHVFVASGVYGAAPGLVSGFGLGAFVAGAYLMMSYTFSRQAAAMKMIDIGHAAGSAAAIGLALGLLL